MNAKDLAEIGLISKENYVRDQKMEEIRRSTLIASGKGSLLEQAISTSA